ncbi:mavicyanin-like isoform X2 [Vigna unguiculata]|uniref:mavicyanin-like isoform X2 n=1 Tax=Vigna unguiculata TaxID=3917 RepID=UPI0010167F70|nr:mavicyanin-like isoform X2 [Vigna unguiculata]XP_027918393.1 mavicyanin-like isoform X2 [Vigna unguiculata]
MANVEILFLLLTLKLMSLPYITEGEEHVVGGNSGWIIPVNNPSLYSSFAASTTFRVNDTLVFNFRTGAHNVVTLSQKHYESCNVTDIMELFDMSPAKITLNRAGDFYFACAFPSHCSLGQKLSIHVTAGGSSSLTPSEAPLPPPPHSRAPTLLAVTVPVLVMAVATNLLFHCY